MGQQKTGGVHWFSFWFSRYSIRKRCSMSANSTKAEKPRNLWAFIETLVASDRQPTTIDDPPWFKPGDICEIDEKTYWYFLELLPPRWMDGNWFAFGEGAGCLRLFWQVKDAYLARELTADETRTFRELSGVSLNP
jgi:hypothetical protein